MAFLVLTDREHISWVLLLLQAEMESLIPSMAEHQWQRENNKNRAQAIDTKWPFTRIISYNDPWAHMQEVCQNVFQTDF